MSGISPGTPRNRTLENWGGLGAVAYVGLFITGSIVAFSGQPDTDSPPGELISYYGDAGHRDKIAAGWLIAVVAVFFFIWFLGALRQFLRRIDDQGMLPAVATVGGAVYAATTLAAISLDTALKTMSDDTFRDQVFPELIHAADDAGYVIHAGGGAGIGALIVATSLAAWRGSLVPRWAARLGIASGLLAVFSIFFWPQFLIAIWLLVAGVLLFRTAPSPAPSP